MHIFKLNFWSKFQRKKIVKSCEHFSRNVSYLFCTVLGGRVVQNHKKWGDVVYGWSLSYMRKCQKWVSFQCTQVILLSSASYVRLFCWGEPIPLPTLYLGPPSSSPHSHQCIAGVWEWFINEVYPMTFIIDIFGFVPLCKSKFAPLSAPGCPPPPGYKRVGCDQKQIFFLH